MERERFVAEGKMEVGPTERYFVFLEGEHLGQRLVAHFRLPEERGYTDLERAGSRRCTGRQVGVKSCSESPREGSEVVTEESRARNVNEAAARFADALAESYRIVYGQAAQAQERQNRLAREFSERVMENLRRQTEEGRAASEQLVGQARQQQEAGRELAQASTDAYVDFLEDAFSRYQAGTQRAVGSAQEGTRAASRTATGVVGIATGVATDAAGAAADATQNATEIATRQPPIDGYDEMTVDEIAKRLEGLNPEELRRTRAYEQRNENRVTLIEQIDRKLGATP